MTLTLTIAAYFALATVIAVGGARLRRGLLPLAMTPFAAQLVIVVTGSWDGGVETTEWLPTLGVDLTFRVDSLTRLLTAVVAAIGLLIVVYSGRYVADAARRVRFLALIVVFTGGMAGLVASDNIFGLFVFWEVTTIASYLLIGFDDAKAGARAAALQAALVTTAGGLAMLAGFILLAQAAGTPSLGGIIAAPPDGTLGTVATGLVLLGAFTKSAQFPFHFWLPGAMAAPTPASAYLHSATMVKAGIVLLVLLAPGFADQPIWSIGVTSVGLVTMSMGAAQALRQHDLKLLLAHGTVSQLGFMVALIGVGLTGVALAVLVAHAVFKAALFLVVGVIDKETGTRDIRRLSGLRRSSPALAFVAAVAALSMAGIPPLLGFATKEAAFDALITEGAWAVLGIGAVASALTVAYAARFWTGAFAELPHRVDRPRVGRIDLALLAPPALLAGASIVLGLLPAPLGEMAGNATDTTVKLVLWPGWKPALAVSAVVVAMGGLYHVASGRDWASPNDVRRRIERWRVPRAQSIYEAAVRSLNTTADRVTGIVQNGSLPVYLAVILTTVFVVTGTTWLATHDAAPDTPFTNGWAEPAIGVVAIAAAFAATRAQRRMAAALLLGAVGFSVAGIYVSFGAPDLALTQLLVETFTIALFAFVLSRLPRQFGEAPKSLSRPVRLTVAALAGVFVTAAALLATSATPQRTVAEFYVDQAEPAGGRNVVNVILTDFRALDTLGEIMVLAAAGVGVAALVRSIRSAGRTGGSS